MKYYLGIDVGSSYTKFIIIDENLNIIFQKIIKTLSRNKDEEQITFELINSKFSISSICATGYGRNYYKNANITKTELYCAAVGTSSLYPFDKTIIDIGGEDIKTITCSSEGKVIDFYMNTKCAAGTGAFITEVAERAEIELSTMSQLAEKSNYKKELNSFCTVFAKTEIMQWILDETAPEDIAKGIYISVVNRIKKIPIDKSLPIILIGGVAEYHSHLKTILSESLNKEVIVPDNPQFINAYGAAIFAMNINDK